MGHKSKPSLKMGKWHTQSIQVWRCPCYYTVSQVVRWRLPARKDLNSPGAKESWSANWLVISDLPASGPFNICCWKDGYQSQDCRRQPGINCDRAHLPPPQKRWHQPVTNSIFSASQQLPTHHVPQAFERNSSPVDVGKHFGLRCFFLLRTSVTAPQKVPGWPKNRSSCSAPAKRPLSESVKDTEEKQGEQTVDSDRSKWKWLAQPVRQILSPRSWGSCSSFFLQICF